MQWRSSPRFGAYLAWAFVCAACGSDRGSGQGLGTGGCLTDQQICQFTKGTSTETDVKAALGNAQEYLGANTWAYVCQQIVGQQAVHNDLVVFDFDSSAVLDDVTVLRQGTAATPPPSCSAGAGGAGGAGDTGGAGGQTSGSACSSVPLPQPDTTSCSGVMFGAGTPLVTTCKDQVGNTWSSSCLGSSSSCDCSYNGASACTCTKSASGLACCPGLP